MKFPWTLSLILFAAVGAAGIPVSASQAMGHGHAHQHGGVSAPAASDWVEGEVKKVDREARKVTLKHGEIKSLDMPGMTMAFLLKDPAMADRVKVGDKIRFRVEKSATGFVVTELQNLAP